jgi:2-oxoisovalerate dehydrogenase E1 component
MVAGEEAAKIEQVNAAFARDMLTRMTFVRAFEAKALSLTQTTPPLIAGSIHLCAGQEAVPLGTLAALREDDQILATYRGHGWAIAAGIDPTEIMAEICHRKNGVNGGRAGSAYFMAPHTRFIGENSIVGAGTTIACGIALANIYHRNGRVVVVSIGDGAMNQGAVHEAMAFAAARNLRVIFICENNGWSELTATSDMFRLEPLAQRGTAYGILSATIAGTDPILVRDSILLAAKQCRDSGRPALIECRVPRLWGHYNRDIEHYRPRADKRQAEAEDPLVLLGERLVASGFMTIEEVADVRLRETAAVERLAKEVVASALPDQTDAQSHVIAEPTRHISLPESTADIQEMTYIAAVNAALHAELQGDPAVVVYGEDVGKAGGIFGATRNLQRDFGAERVFDTPIAENAILGSAIGAALGGLKPIVEIMWADFLFVALDQLVNQAANVRYVTRGRSSVPLVVRTQQGAVPGSCAQHSQSIEAILAHIPGLKVALAATPQDAYTLLRSAAADPDPCVVIEARALYQTRGPVSLAAAAEPAGRARLHRTGKDGAIVTWGTMLPRALEAADALEREGLSVSVLDLRWLAPLDEQSLESVVRNSGGRVAVVHEAVKTGGFGAEIVARIQELCGDALRKPVVRIATPDVRMPASPLLQSALIPSAAHIVQKVRSLLQQAAVPA